MKMTVGSDKRFDEERKNNLENIVNFDGFSESTNETKIIITKRMTLQNKTDTYFLFNII